MIALLVILTSLVVLVAWDVSDYDPHEP